jgi:rRNA-processing protein FCF1
LALAGGNLRIEQAARRGPDAADDRIVELVTGLERARVVTSDRGLRRRLSEQSGSDVELIGVSHFRALIRY